MAKWTIPDKLDAALSPAPSPDAIVRAALDRAAHDAYVACAETRHVTLGLSVSARIENLAADPEARAAIIEQAKGME